MIIVLIAIIKKYATFWEILKNVDKWERTGTIMLSQDLPGIMWEIF